MVRRAASRAVVVVISDYYDGVALGLPDVEKAKHGERFRWSQEGSC